MNEKKLLQYTIDISDITLAKKQEATEFLARLEEARNLKIIIAWVAGEMSEGMAARQIGVDRLRLRTMKSEIIESVFSLLKVEKQ